MVNPLVKRTTANCDTEIQQLFGASTADGIAFQFRTVKANAKVLQDAVDSGNNPVKAFTDATLGSGGGSVPATPSTRTPGTGKRTRAPRTGGSTAASSKRRKIIKPEPDIEDDVDSPDADYDALDETPTKPKVKYTPRKNEGELFSRSAWAKPAPGEPTQPSSFAVAASSAQTAAPSYGLAPIPGVSPSLAPARPSFSPAVSYSTAVPTTTARSPAMRPAQTAPSFYGSYNDPAYGTQQQTGMGMGMTQAQYYDPPTAHQTSMSTTPMDAFSPSADTGSEVNTPNTAISSSTMTRTMSGGGAAAGYGTGYGDATAAPATAPNTNHGDGYTSFKSEPGSENGSASTYSAYRNFINDDESMYTTSANFNGSGYHHQQYHGNGYEQDEYWDEGDV